MVDRIESFDGSSLGLEAVLEAARSIALEAGELLLDFRERLHELEIDRKGRIDLVTRADLESERLVRRRIAERFPGHRVHGEELGEDAPPTDVDAPDSEDLPLWVVDPLDGTTNFVHGHPMFAVSIGFVSGGGVRAGVVHAPALRETFAARIGGGAWLGDRRIEVSRTDSLGESLVASGFPYRRAEIPDNNVRNFARMVPRVRGVRRGGSAALDLAYVAAGRFDGYWEQHLSPWDIAAGACLVLEAGGRVTDFEDGDRWRDGETIVATNGRIHTELRSHLDASGR